MVRNMTYGSWALSLRVVVGDIWDEVVDLNDNGEDVRSIGSSSGTIAVSGPPSSLSSTFSSLARFAFLSFLVGFLSSAEPS